MRATSLASGVPSRKSSDWLCSAREALDTAGSGSTLSAFFCGNKCCTLNTLRPRQDGRYFADDIFECIFLNENFCTLIKISLKSVRKRQIDNNPVLGSDNGLAPNRRQAIIWTNDGVVWWRIYAFIGLNELDNWVIFQMWSHFLTMFTIDIIFMLEIIPVQWIFSSTVGTDGLMNSTWASVARVLSTHPYVSSC